MNNGEMNITLNKLTCGTNNVLKVQSSSIRTTPEGCKALHDDHVVSSNKISNFSSHVSYGLMKYYWTHIYTSSRYACSSKIARYVTKQLILLLQVLGPESLVKLI